MLFFLLVTLALLAGDRDTVAVQNKEPAEEEKSAKKEKPAKKQEPAKKKEESAKQEEPAPTNLAGFGQAPF